MEELQPQDIEDLLKALEEEYAAQESLPQEVEELLHILQSGSLHLDRRDAAERLGNVRASSPRIVRALRAAKESDPYATVGRAAAKSLRAPVHQEYLQQHPDLMEATETALQQRPGVDKWRPLWISDRRRRVKGQQSEKPTGRRLLGILRILAAGVVVIVGVFFACTWVVVAQPTVGRLSLTTVVAIVVIVGFSLLIIVQYLGVLVELASFISRIIRKR